MNVYALHEGIQYHIEEVAKEQWRWSFQPPAGRRHSGRVAGERLWAAAVACRAIEVWRETHPASKAA